MRLFAYLLEASAALLPAVSYAQSLRDCHAGFRAQLDGQNAEAVSHLSRCLETVGLKKQLKVGALISRARASTSLEDFVDADRDYSQALVLDPLNVTALNNRGFVRTRLKRYTDAIEDLSAAITQNYRHAYAHANRGYAHMKLGHHRLARKDLIISL